MADEWIGSALPAIGEDTKMKTEVLEVGSMALTARHHRRGSAMGSLEDTALHPSYYLPAYPSPGGSGNATAPTATACSSGASHGISPLAPLSPGYYEGTTHLRPRVGSFQSVSSNGPIVSPSHCDGSRGSALPPAVIPVRRRRFHSSDLSARGLYGQVDSPTWSWAARQPMSSSLHGGAPLHPSMGFVDSSNLVTRSQHPRQYARRRTLSESKMTVSSVYTIDPSTPEGSADGYFDEGDGEPYDGEYDERFSEQSDMIPRRRHASDDSCASSSSMISPSLTTSSRTLARTMSSEMGDRKCMEKLLNLQKLYQEGFITVTEFKERRLQLVDELSVPAEKTIKRTTDLLQTELPIVYHEPPEFSLLRERDAIKHVFDSEKRQWSSYSIKVKIDPNPFAKGGLRQVYHMQDLSVPPGPDGRITTYVAKVAMDPNENPDTYFRDVEMQAVAAKFANLYNTYNPPRRVEFLEAWILQLVPSNAPDAENLTMRGTICGVEPFIAGEYHKHNNNFGYVSELERNTPQAFSHFTYEASGHQILVVDIQGVGDHYTDPQIHTRTGKEFGKGNLSIRGFARFLESHRCNPICKYLKLPLNNPKEECALVDSAGAEAADFKGTIPAQPYMSQPRVQIDRIESELCHYYGDSTAYRLYQARKKKEAAEVSQTHALVAAMQQHSDRCTLCGFIQCCIS